jgi:hypothetical protein
MSETANQPDDEAVPVADTVGLLSAIAVARRSLFCTTRQARLVSECCNYDDMQRWIVGCDNFYRR